jgi:polygalacturonase
MVYWKDEAIMKFILFHEITVRLSQTTAGRYRKNDSMASVFLYSVYIICTRAVMLLQNVSDAAIAFHICIMLLTRSFIL